jgi:hypothetical protein
MCRVLTAVLLIISAAFTPVHAFTTSLPFQLPSKAIGSATTARVAWIIYSLPTSSLQAYGRGAEIWPESQDDAIQLADSFPHGQVPYSAVIAIEQADMNVVHQHVEASVNHRHHHNHENRQARDDNHVETVSIMPSATSVRNIKTNSSSGNIQTRQILPSTQKRRYLHRILRRAAAKEELVAEQQRDMFSSPLYKTSMLIAFSLIVRGWIRPMDVVVVACLSTYFIILNMAAQSSRDWTSAPIMPSIPPQGHVPTIVSHPLGRRMDQSMWYNAWLKLGVLLGLLGPWTILFRSFVAIKMGGFGSSSSSVAGMAVGTCRVYARPLFLLCCQFVTETLFRRSLVRSKRHVEFGWLSGWTTVESKIAHAVTSP